jgi:hypothetical protein
VKPDLGKQLRDADPLREDAELSPAEVRAMREAVLSRVDLSSRRAYSWTFMSLAAVLGSLVLVAAVVTSRDKPVSGTVREPSTAQPLQMQFQTPTGTRIVWVLNPNLPL